MNENPIEWVSRIMLEEQEARDEINRYGTEAETDAWDVHDDNLTQLMVIRDSLTAAAVLKAWTSLDRDLRERFREHEWWPSKLNGRTDQLLEKIWP